MECVSVPSIDCSEFCRRLQGQVSGRRIPLTGSIEVTARCNLRCAHCYINLPAADTKARQEEMSCRDLCRFVDQIVDEGCLWLLLTGGEPFIRDDFLDIYTHSRKKGLLITLFTNGTLLTRRIAEHLAEWPPFKVEITFYGCTEQTYERVAGLPGSFKRCMQGIELLLALKLPVKLKTMVTTLNQHEVEEMGAYAEGLGLEFRFDPLLNARLNGDRTPTQFRISPQEVLALDCADKRRMQEWQEFHDRFMAPPLQPDYLYQCGAGLNTFHIDPYGAMSACMMSRTPSYDLRHGTFQQGWHEFMPDVRTQRWTRDSPCKRCDLISLCEQCPGWAQIEKGDQESRVEYLCEIAHLRANTFGKRASKEKKGVE